MHTTTKNRKDTIRTFLKGITVETAANPNIRSAVERGLKIVWANQTPDEQASHTTNKLNGKGFNGRDAQWAGILITAMDRYGSLSVKQAVSAAKMLAKYAGQIDAATATA